MYLLSWNVDQLGVSKRLEAVANAIASTEPDIRLNHRLWPWGFPCRQVPDTAH